MFLSQVSLSLIIMGNLTLLNTSYQVIDFIAQIYVGRKTQVILPSLNIKHLLP